MERDALLPALAIRRPVATAMVYLIVVTLGAGALRFLPVDLLPDIELARLTVFVRYPNVGPEEIETIITDRLENALSSLPGLERISSTSEEGRSRVNLEFARGTDLAEAANDVRAALDGVRDELPLEADPPGIWKFDPNAREVVTLAVTSRMPLPRLTRFLERDVAQRFKQIPGVGAVTLGGGIYREIQVQLRRDRLAAAGLAPDDVRAALARENVKAPGGNVKAGISDLYVRTLGELSSVEELKDVVVAVRDGAPIRLRHLADVVDGYADIHEVAELDGVPSVRIEIQKQSGANTVAVAERIRAEARRIDEERADLQLRVIQDQSEFIRQSMESVQSGALLGGLLALLVLYAFLRARSPTLIIGLSIPISILASFALLYFGGLTLNQMTFGGLALGIGMMVDNSIVVLENIVRQRQERGLDPAAAARVGTSEVATAIIASTLTTCVIFVPVVFMQSTSGQLFRALALVVVFSLACSLLVALTLVPMLASRFLSVAPPAQRSPGRFARVEAAYAGLIDRALRRRGVVFAASLAIVVGSLALWPLVSVELAPQTDTNEIDVELEMARGINLAVAKTYLDELEAIVRPLLPADVDSMSTEVRASGDAELEIRLAPAHRRTTDTGALAERIRAAVDGRIPGAEIEVKPQSGLWILRRLFQAGGGDEDVELQVRGHDLARADAVARAIRARIETVPGVVGVRLERREGTPEWNLRFQRDKIAALGLNVADVARAVQTSVGGAQAGTYREGGDEIPIVVRLRPDDRLTVEDLEDIAVRTPAGEMVPVSSLVVGGDARGPSSIRRVDGQRVTFVTANLQDGVAYGDAVEAIRAALRTLPVPDGTTIDFGGAYEEQERAARDFLLTILIAIALVYMVMAAQFERFVDPLIVMTSVPLAIAGVLPTLVLTGTTLNIQSIMGLVMLIGIVVNNAIVLVDCINLKRREGSSIRDAAREAARLRLRPILMTTTTTVLGLLTLAVGVGAGGALQAPLGRVVIGGLLASTALTLLLVPVLYAEVAERADRLRR